MSSFAWVGPRDLNDMYDLRGLYYYVDRCNTRLLAVVSALSLSLRLNTGWDDVNVMMCESPHGRGCTFFAKGF